MIYVIVYCGYEGIESLLWAGADADEARTRVLAYRERCKRVAAVRESKRFDRIKYPWSSRGEPDRICVVSQGEEELRCCCKTLGVSPSKPVYM